MEPNAMKSRITPDPRCLCAHALRTHKRGRYDRWDSPRPCSGKDCPCKHYVYWSGPAPAAVLEDTVYLCPPISSGDMDRFMTACKAWFRPDDFTIGLTTDPYALLRLTRVRGDT